MRFITTADAPTPAGHYSQGVVQNGLVFVSGQLPIDPQSGVVIDADIEAQTELTLRNLEAILVEAGSGLGQVVSLMVFVVARDDWPVVNAVCARMFGTHRPSRAVVGGADLKAGCLVEITAIGSVADRS